MLIPGLDGTGLLFQPLVEMLDDSIEVTHINLNDSPYDQLVDSILAKMGDSKFILLAESFGGHIAYEIAKRVPHQIDKLIIAASFLSRPSKLTFLIKCLPLRFIKTKTFPDRLIDKIAFGNFASKELISKFYSVLNEVSDELIGQRLALVHRLKIEPQEVMVPCTYVAAKADYFIRNSCYREFEEVFSNFDKVEVEGGHFIVQSNPQVFANLIKNINKNISPDGI